MLTCGCYRFAVACWLFAGVAAGCSDGPDHEPDSGRRAPAPSQDGGAPQSAGASASGGGASGGTGVAMGAGAARGPLTPIAEAGFVEALSAARCDWIEACCDQAGYESDLAACRDAVRAFAEVATRADHPAYRYDPMQAARCVAAHEALSPLCARASLPVQSGDNEDERGPCAGVYYGTVPEGGACENHGECAGGPASGVLCLEGLCRRRARGRAGDECSALCMGDPAQPLCRTTRTPLEAALCFVEDGLFCLRECTPIVADGEHCTGELGECREGSVCIVHTSVSEDDECSPRVPLGGFCLEPGHDCARGTYCSGETCVVQARPGEYCENGRACEGACIDGICTAYEEARGVDRDFCRGTGL